MSVKDIRPALRAFLLADAGIAAMVGAERIYPLVLPQGVTQPSIVYSRITGFGDHHMQGASGLTRPRLQIDAWAAAADDATDLADLVKARLDGFSGALTAGAETVEVQGVFFDSEREDYEKDLKLYRISRDYLVWFAER